MSTFFPGDEQHPDHRPIPRLNVPVRKVATGGVVVLASYALCPATHEEHEHTPHHETTPTALPQRALSVGADSTRAVPFVPLDFTAQTAAIQTAAKRRNARIAAFASGMFAPPAALWESFPSSSSVG